MNPILRILETSRKYLLGPCASDNRSKTAIPRRELRITATHDRRLTIREQAFESLAFQTLLEYEFDD